MTNNREGIYVSPPISKIRDLVAKVVMIGDPAVGKTSLRNRLLGAAFNPFEPVTVGAGFSRIKVPISNTVNMILQIWDIAGQQSFELVTKTYYDGAKGAILVYDVTRESTFHDLPHWIKKLVEYNRHQKIPLVLVANKLDLVDQIEVSPERGRKYATQLSKWLGLPVPYFETSAKTGENVALPFVTLARNIKEYMDKYVYGLK